MQRRCIKAEYVTYNFYNSSTKPKFYKNASLVGKIIEKTFLTNQVSKEEHMMLHIKLKIQSTQYHMLSLNHPLMILLKPVLVNPIHVNIRKNSNSKYFNNQKPFQTHANVGKNKYLIDKTAFCGKNAFYLKLKQEMTI